MEGFLVRFCLLLWEPAMIPYAKAALMADDNHCMNAQLEWISCQVFFL